LANEKKDFLNNVEEQIAWRPLRKTLSQELEEHIFDRMEAYQTEGISQEEAEALAVRDMGDPIVIGTNLNEVHQIQKAPSLAILTLLLSALGLAGSAYMRWSPEQWSNGFFYYVPGLLVLFLMSWKGYPMIIRHSRWLIRMAGGLFFVEEFLIARRLVLFWQMGYLRYFSILLFGPFLILLAYRMRRYRSKTILMILTLCGIIICLPGFYFDSRRDLPACLVLLAGVAGALLLMIHREIFSGNSSARKRLYGLTLAGVAAVGVLFGATRERREMIRWFLWPEDNIQSTWDDTYNSILIRQLLRETPLVGGIELTPRELMDYGTGAWYFAERDPRQIGVYAIHKTEQEVQKFDALIAEIREAGGNPRYIHFDESNVTLWDILPQHYHNNYRIIIAILLFGWLAGAVLVAAIGGFYWLLFVYIRKIRGKLAFSLSCCCGFCLLTESILYLLGNFGYQYAAFTNLPMISEGRISILVNMAMLGFIFSAYRYDRVEVEPVSMIGDSRLS